MQVWNLLHAAHWKHGRKSHQKSPSGHHRPTWSSYISATKARIDNQKKLVKHQYLLHMSSQYGELRPTNGWDRLTSLGHPCKFQLVSSLGSITARHLVVGVSQTLRRSTEGATYTPQGDHHVGHWPTFLVPQGKAGCNVYTGSPTTLPTDWRQVSDCGLLFRRSAILTADK